MGILAAIVAFLTIQFVVLVLQVIWFILKVRVCVGPILCLSLTVFCCFFCFFLRLYRAECRETLLEKNNKSNMCHRLSR